jgi:iron(III) transport system ATP-binding protein
LPSIKLNSITKKFGATTAVDNINIDIEDGVLLTLLGPSGCGKTTTLRCIAGLETPDEGEIIVGAKTFFSSTKRISLSPEKRNLGMVFQSYAVWPHMNVFDNIAFPLKKKKLATGEIRERVKDVLSIVNLEGFEDRAATKLSGGQQQRVVLARAIIHNPEVLLLDEPLSNLDAILRERMRVEIKQLQKKLGITSIYVTHDQIEALAISDKIVVMNSGKIEAKGSPKDIYEKPCNKFVASFIGRANLFQGDIISLEKKSKNWIVKTEMGPLRVYDEELGVKKEGKRINLTVKPERINLNSEAPIQERNTNVLCGEVIAAQYLGAQTEYQIKLGAILLRAVLDATSESRRFANGEKVYLTIDPRALIVCTG